MKGARIVEFDKLREVIGDYQQLDFPKGAIELPLYCAEALDADGLGKEYWQTAPPEISIPLDGQGRSNNAPDDPRRPAWERRARCYDLVLDSLETFEKKAASGDDAERVRAHAYELAFASSDEIFHSRLYEWLISRGLADQLLEVRESHFYRVPNPEVSSLCRCVHHTYRLIFNASRERLTSISFCGNFMSKTVNRSAPLKYLPHWQNRLSACFRGLCCDFFLAFKRFSLSLSQRIEYLTLAVGNAKSHPVSAGGKHESAISFLTDLEEKLDVSQVQLEIFFTLSPRLQAQPTDSDLREKVELLERGLFNITEVPALICFSRIRWLIAVNLALSSVCRAI